MHLSGVWNCAGGGLVLLAVVTFGHIRPAHAAAISEVYLGSSGSVPSYIEVDLIGESGPFDLVIFQGSPFDQFQVLQSYTIGTTSHLLTLLHSGENWPLALDHEIEQIAEPTGLDLPDQATAVSRWVMLFGRPADAADVNIWKEQENRFVSVSPDWPPLIDALSYCTSDMWRFDLPQSLTPQQSINDETLSLQPNQAMLRLRVSQTSKYTADWYITDANPIFLHPEALFSKPSPGWPNPLYHSPEPAVFGLMVMVPWLTQRHRRRVG